MSEHMEDANNTDQLVGSAEYTHPLEKWLRHDWVRYILRRLAAERPGTAQPHLYRALYTYGDSNSRAHERLLYWPIHKIIDKMRGTMSREQLRTKLAGHPPTLRGIVATARSVGRYGLTIPQRWISPLFIVWNFTDQCNLSCNHCYQSSTAARPDGELSLEEKLKLIDQLNRNYIAMIAFAGGEPTLSDDLDPVLERCREYGIHTSLATHGGTLTKERCEKLARAGLKYVEVSLDSIDPEKHDRFRGQSGMWQKSVEGIKNVVATEGLRAGLAMCVTKENIHEVEKMLEFAVELGVSCFAHFNFIPTGRGGEMAQQDISPQQREELLYLLREWMNARRIGVISTAPQFGRLCLMSTGVEDMISCSHAGNAAGTKARVVAKYLGGCGAGRTYACLQPNGDVTPCVYMPDRTMGNIRRKSLTKIFQESEWWDLFCNRDEREGNCGTCDWRNYCGGCRARADAYFNRLDQSDPGCIYNLDQWQKLTQQPVATTVQTNGSTQKLYRQLRASST
jgi:radical SAM protein with 4Fe4S-binding SPASM domain